MATGISLGGLKPGLASQYGALLGDGGCCSLPERRGTYAIAGASGEMYLSHFRVPASQLAATVRVGNGVAAGATPTLCRLGLYRVAANGDISLIASTANDTTLFGTGYTSYSRALTVPVQLIEGEWLAAGVLVVSAAAMPDMIAPLPAGSAFLATRSAPKLATFVFGLTDLPASVVSASVLDGNVNPWMEIHP